MNNTNNIDLTLLTKRSMAALFLQAAISFLIYNVAVVQVIAEGWFLALLLVTSLLSFGLAIHAADGYFVAGRYIVCWIFPIPPICIFLIFLVMAWAASYIPTSCSRHVDATQRTHAINSGNSP